MNTALNGGDNDVSGTECRPGQVHGDLNEIAETCGKYRLGHCLQCDNNGFVPHGIRTVMVNRSAQVQTPLA